MIKLKKPDNTTEIRIGIVIAGAVTAGAYSAGVMDYLLETLQIWHDRYHEDKKQGIKNVPRPNVQIDVIAGASAGSIVGAAATLGMAFGLNKPVVNSKDQNDDNLLFDVWVNLGEKVSKEDIPVLNKLLLTDDLKDKFESLLNSDFITDLVKQIKKKVYGSSIRKLPPFINPRLKILNTLTNLKGIPMQLGFGGSDDKSVDYVMSYHKAYTLFEYGKSTQDTSEQPSSDDYLPLNFNHRDKDNRSPDLDLLLRSARASGAFPIGLKAVSFAGISTNYIKQNIKRIFPGAPLEPLLPKDTENFTAVDGGTVNNEPIGEVTRLLNDSVDDDGNPFYSLLFLIDPFPNSYSDEELKEIKNNKNKNFDLDTNLPSVLFKLIRTLRKQSHFKESDISQYFSHGQSDKQRHMIWPTRKINGTKVPFPLASAVLDGFGGFFSRDFREHDYLLGKKNCQNFLRKHLTYHGRLEMDKYVASEWKDQSYKTILAKFTRDGSFPIIPDVRLFDDPNYDIEKSLPKERPKIDYRVIHNVIPNLSKRYKRLIEKLSEAAYDETANNRKSDTLETNKKIKSIEVLKTKSFLGKLKIKFMNTGLKLLIVLTKSGISRQLAKKTAFIILSELSRHDLLIDKKK